MPSISKQFHNNLLNYEDKANNGNNIGSVLSQKSELCLLLYCNGDGVAKTLYTLVHIKHVNICLDMRTLFDFFPEGFDFLLCVQ